MNLQFMILSQAKKLKIGDTLYHQTCRTKEGKVYTCKVTGLVQINNSVPSFAPRWAIQVQDMDSNKPRMLIGKYAFNWSTTPPNENHKNQIQ